MVLFLHITETNKRRDVHDLKEFLICEDFACSDVMTTNYDKEGLVRQNVVVVGAIAARHQFSQQLTGAK